MHLWLYNIGTATDGGLYDHLSQEFAIDYHSYDIIKGYRADDSYFSFAQDFLNGTISVSQLSDAMKLGDLGVSVRMIEQYEQGRKDINRASSATVLQLSRALGCRMEDLIE